MPLKRCLKVLQLQILILRTRLEVTIESEQSIAATAITVVQQGIAASLTVNKANPTVPAPTLNPTSPISLGGSVTATVTISGVSGVTPTGTVTFQYSTNSGSTWTQLGAVKTLSSGSATSDSYTPNAVGSNYRIRAIYSGDNNYNNATGSAASLTVNKANPTVPAPSVSPNPVVVNNPVTVSVTISGVSGGATPTGTATFQVKIGTGSWTTIGSAVSLSSGSASTTYVPQTVGSYQFQVVYSGDTNYNGATGSAVSVTVNFPPPDHFEFSSVGTQTAGTSFSITITAKDVYGNTVTGYVGTPSLTYSAGSISPNVMGAFVGGVGSASVTVTAAGSGVTITAVDGTRAGASNSFAVTLAPTPTPSQTLSPTYTPSPTATPSRTPSPTPTPTPTLTPPPTSPSPSPSPTASPSENSASLPPEILYYELVVVLITTIIITAFAINIYYFKTPYKSLKT